MLRLRRARHVRLHFQNADHSLEGFLVPSANGHYRLLRPMLLETPERTHSLEGEAWIPRANVEFIQVLP